MANRVWQAPTQQRDLIQGRCEGEEKAEQGYGNTRGTNTFITLQRRDKAPKQNKVLRKASNELVYRENEHISQTTTQAAILQDTQKHEGIHCQDNINSIQTLPYQII